ncbi:MAG TPA: Rieske 2Fe-2S domain-containing protein [Vicinamibacterales bacterium]|nr:Rieske 2Fe-2S domain-containing protein [Vicinamibacterales bacterium]
MSDGQPDPRAVIDVQIDSPGREGLTGTAPASVYMRLVDREEITVPPDFAPPEARPAWRQDFPIDWPQDQYVERRDFMKFMVLTSAAFTLGQCWIATRSWLRTRRGRPPLTRIASLDEMPIGSTVVFAYPGNEDACVLVRLSETDLVAYSQKCTHLSCAVIPRPEQGVLHCPCHDGYFDLRSGRPTAGPPQRPLPRILLQIRGRDVYAAGVEIRTT